MIVVDASVVANAVGDAMTAGAQARARLATADEVAAPDLIDVEVVSVLRKRWLAGDLTTRRFSATVNELQELPIERYAAKPLLRRLYELRANLTPYDALYVSLAEELGCPVLTADARLSRAPGIRCPVEVLTA